MASELNKIQDRFRKRIGPSMVWGALPPLAAILSAEDVVSGIPPCEGGWLGAEPRLLIFYMLVARQERRRSPTPFHVGAIPTEHAILF